MTASLVDTDHLTQFAEEVRAGLTRPHQKELPSKYFYDEVTRQLKDLPPGARVTDVILWETDTSRAQYRPGA